MTFIAVQLSLSRLNYQWPECEGHPEMMESVAAGHLCLQRGLKGCNETLQLVHSHTGDTRNAGGQDCRRVHEPSASAGVSWPRRHRGR